MRVITFSQILLFDLGDLHSLKFFQDSVRQSVGGFEISIVVSLPEVLTLHGRSELGKTYVTSTAAHLDILEQENP